MLFAIDVGNTNVVMGLFSKENKLAASWRLGTDQKKTVDEHEVIVRSLLAQEPMDLDGVHGAVIASVVPSLTELFEALCRKLFGLEPVVVGPGTKTGMAIKMDNPREVGADRIANGVAAYDLYGGPVIVADFGTATTFDVVSAAGEYLGGVICPGINISMEALFQRTAKLPRVELKRPDNIIGKNTVASMQSGIMCSVIGGIDYTIDAIRGELGMPAPVIATGGLAKLLQGQTAVFDVVNPDLTLEGLRIIFNRNR